MTLAVATRLGPHEIVAPIGASGVGEVYRARDTRLGRDVAIKVLPAAFATDAERLTRRRPDKAHRAPSVRRGWALGLNARSSGDTTDPTSS